MNDKWKNWLKAAAVRAVRTGVLSPLTSVAGLPEVDR